MMKSSFEISGRLRRSSKSCGDGVACAAMVWPWRKTIILLPPTQIEPEQDWVNQIYLEEMVAVIKRKTGERSFLSTFIPLRWKIYICSEGSVASVKLRPAEFGPVDVPGGYRSKAIARFVQDEIDRQRASKGR